MKVAKHKREYGEAHKRLYVDPLLSIHICILGKAWAWTLHDANGTANGRSWKVDGAEGYDTAEDALQDAKESYLRALKGGA